MLAPPVDDAPQYWWPPVRTAIATRCARAYAIARLISSIATPGCTKMMAAGSMLRSELAELVAYWYASAG